MDPIRRAIFLAAFCITVAVSTSDFNNGTTVNLEGFFNRRKDKPGPTHIPLKRIDANMGCFVGEITVGSKFNRGGFLSAEPPSNKYEVMFDTLTSNSWLFGMSKLTAGYRSGYGNYLPFRPHESAVERGGIRRSPYNCDMSKTAKDIKREGGFTEVYFDGSNYEGGFVTDSMTIGPYNLGEVRMGLVNQVGMQALSMRGNDFDGIVGLGPLGWNTHGLTSVFNGIKESADGVKQDAIVSFYVSKSMRSGEITFGGHNQKLMADRDGVPGTFSYAKTVQFEMYDADPYSGGVPTGKTNGMEAAQRWAVPIVRVTVNGNQIAANYHLSAIFDTAAPYGLIVPGERYLRMLTKAIGNGAEVTDDKLLVIDCAKLEELAPLVLKFGEGVEATFEPKEYFPYEINNGPKEKLCSSFFVLVEDKTYYDIDFAWGIGLGFMTKYYVQFQSRFQQEPMIGFGLSTGDEIPYEEQKMDKQRSFKRGKKKNGMDKQRSFIKRGKKKNEE